MPLERLTHLAGPSVGKSWGADAVVELWARVTLIHGDNRIPLGSNPRWMPVGRLGFSMREDEGKDASCSP